MRYFLEVSYKGTNYSGFQSQKNANTIQAEIEKALTILFRISASQIKSVPGRDVIPGYPGIIKSSADEPSGYRDGINLIGSSRTDAGVHAVQNFFHFDFDGEINPRLVYKVNSVLHPILWYKNLSL